MKKKIILITLLAVILICLGGVFFINQAFQFIFRSQMEGYFNKNNVQSTDDPNRKKESPSKEPAGSEKYESMDPGAGQQANPGSVEKGRITGGNSPGSGEGGVQSPQAQSSWSYEERKGQKETGSKTGVIPLDKVKEIESGISLVDKAKAMKIILSRLKSSDITLLKGMLKDGITSAEAEEARDILKNRVTSQEQEELKQLFFKYEALLY